MKEEEMLPAVENLMAPESGVIPPEVETDEGAAPQTSYIIYMDPSTPFGSISEAAGTNDDPRLCCNYPPEMPSSMLT